MLSIIRPSTYQANLEQLHPEFYQYRKLEDQIAADLIGKNLLKLLKKAPAAYKRQQQQRQQQQSETDSCERISESSSCNEDQIFQSDSSLSSNCSTLSSNSSTSSLRSSLSSLTDAMKDKIKRRENSKVEVILPEDMMTRIVRDLVRMGEGEEHGIRGCYLNLELMDGDSILRLGKISCDPSIPATFTLRLRLSSGMPPAEATGSHVLLNRLLGSPSQYLYIRPGYIVEKAKR